MFTPEFFIDTIQSTKQAVFHRITQDTELRQVADRYLQAQTEFAKMMVRNTIDMVKYSMDHVGSLKEQASPAPYKVEKEAN